MMMESILLDKNDREKFRDEKRESQSKGGGILRGRSM